MKNIIKTLAAVALIALAASCSKDAAEAPAVVDETAKVSFTVELPGIVSRATNDGTTATELHYAVYQDNGDNTNTLLFSTDAEDQVKTMSGLSTTVELDLVSQQTYDIVFWAQAQGAYDPDFAAKSVAMNYDANKVGSNEARDAFVYVWNNLTVNGSINETVVLRRPFAQLNVALTQGQIAAADKAGFTLDKVQVSAATRNAFGFFAAEQGAATGDMIDIVFEAANYLAPVSGKNANGEDLHQITANGTTYDWVSFNYLLPALPSDVADVEIIFTDKNGKTIEVPAFTNVPIERNHRTNIVGDLLTDPAKFEVVILPGFEDEVHDVVSVDSAESLQAAIKNGNKLIALANDITVDKWIMFSETKTIGNGKIITVPMNGLTINGNGHTLTINSIESANNGNHLFDNASNLNISNLTIKYADGVAGGAISLKSGVISKVNFVGGSSAIYPGDGEIKVEECTFATNATAIYFEQERDNLTITKSTFNQPANTNVVLLRGDVKFTNNIVNSGRTVNIVSGSTVVTGNNFNNVRLKVYAAATAIISNNIIGNLVFETDTHASTFTNNTFTATVPENNTTDVVISTETVTVTVPASDASEGDKYNVEVSNASTDTDATTGETTVAFDLTMYKNDVQISSGTTVYEVAVNVGAGKIIAGVTHNGTALTKADTGADQTYQYDSATGVLTIYTASFSPFAVTYADYKDYVRTKNFFYGGYISVSTGSDLLPIVAIMPEITKYSVFDGDTRITDEVRFRFSNVKKETLSENAYKVSIHLAILNDKGNDLELKPGMPSTINGTEYLHVYMNLIEVPAGYSISEVKVNGTSFVLTDNAGGNPATGEYWVGANPKDLYFQSKTAGLIEVTYTK